MPIATQTKIVDVIQPKIFTGYNQYYTWEKSVFAQSGIMDNSPLFATILGDGGLTVNMPYWDDLTGVDEVFTDDVDSVPKKITSNQEVAMKFFRSSSWSTHDLAGYLAGDDPMSAIVDKVSSWWARQLDETVYSLLEGVQNDATFQAYHESTVATGEISADVLIDACTKTFTTLDQYDLLFVNSLAYASLVKSNQIVYLEHPSEGRPTVPMFMGLRVIVTEKMTVNPTSQYWILSQRGFLAYGVGTPVGYIPTEVTRDVLGSSDILMTRKDFMIHPKKFTLTSDAYTQLATNKTASNAQLSAGTYYSLVKNADSTPERNDILYLWGEITQ